MWSKLRFSIIRKITCLMGHCVSAFSGSLKLGRSCPSCDDVHAASAALAASADDVWRNRRLLTGVTAADPIETGALRGGEISGCDARAPVVLAGLGQRADGVVIRVALRQRLGVVGLDAGAVVLRPVADPQLAVVLVDLVHPALAHERHV